MCGLCGVLGIEHHWTAAPAESQSADVPRRRQERRHRIALINAMLAPERLRVDEWQGVAYVVSTPTGSSEIADNLAMIWAAIERLRGRAFDPLELPDSSCTESRSSAVSDE